MLEYHFWEKFKDKKVKTNFHHEIEPEEILLDKLAKKKEEEIGISEKKMEVPLSKIVIEGIFVVFSLLLLSFFFKTLYFQIIEGENARHFTNNNDIRNLRSIIIA